MKIRIISSCTGEKQQSPAEQLTQEDFRQLHEPAAFEHKESQLANYRLPAGEMYTGLQHKRLMEGVEIFERSVGEESLQLRILSAGYGLIPAGREIVPYECTFQNMRVAEIEEWAEHLQAPDEARKLFAEPADLVLVLLGDKYLRALDLDETVQFAAPTVFFAASSSERHVQGEGQIRVVNLGNQEAKRFSCGLVGLKGEVAKRLLIRLGEEGDAFLAQLFDSELEVLALLDEVAPPDQEGSNGQHEIKAKAKKEQEEDKASSTDWVIKIPQSWWEKPHRQKLRYFIPEWDDRVDPDYDFETDTHSGGTGDWNNEVFAHQMYPSPNYDGILVSKVVAEKTKKKTRRINEMGVHPSRTAEPNPAMCALKLLERPRIAFYRSRKRLHRLRPQ